jgi:hypothetical protein
MYRAVSIMSGPSVVKDSFAGVQNPDWKGLGPALKKEAPTGLTLKREWKECMPVPSSWVVKTDSLEMASFPLELTHRKIPGAEAEEVSSRISEALRCLSIEAEFDDEKAKAKCRTWDYACFRIRLFAGSESGQPVVVELQRRNGPGMSFMQSCRAILCAAEGRALTLLHKKAPPFIKCPVASMKCLQGLQPEIDREAELKIALNKVMELLSKNDSSIVLAMENMCLLTDPVKTSPSMALRASKTILTSDSIYNVREEMTSLLERGGLSSGFGGQNHPDRLRHLALLVLSNALSLAAKDGSLERSIQQDQWFEQFLIPTLMDEVRSAKTSPNNAYVASGCLVSLISCSAVARGLIRAYNGVQVLGEAHEHGVVCHQLLANETERCMKALGASH